MIQNEKSGSISCTSCKNDSCIHQVSACCLQDSSIAPAIIEESTACYSNEDSQDRLYMVASEKIKQLIGIKVTRIESIIAFSHEIGAKKIGIASCITTLPEARVFKRILESHGFECVCIVCKVGGRDKDEIGFFAKEGVLPRFRAMCNPILQAKVLDDRKTDLNVILGLCVGHDTLFAQYSKAPVTVLFTRDEATGNNAVQPLYLLDSVYSYLLKNDTTDKN